MATSDRQAEAPACGAGLPAVAWGYLAPAMVTLAVVLTAVSDRYGFERDDSTSACCARPGDTWTSRR